MKQTHADYWLSKFNRETMRRLEAGRQVEREMIEDAERARDGLPPIVRPFVESDVPKPRPFKHPGRPTDPQASTPYRSRSTVHQHPEGFSCIICAFARRWETGTI